MLLFFFSQRRRRWAGVGGGWWAVLAFVSRSCTTTTVVRVVRTSTAAFITVLLVTVPVLRQGTAVRITQAVSYEQCSHHSSSVQNCHQSACSGVCFHVTLSRRGCCLLPVRWLWYCCTDILRYDIILLLRSTVKRTWIHREALWFRTQVRSFVFCQHQNIRLLFLEEDRVLKVKSWAMSCIISEMSRPDVSKNTRFGDYGDYALTTFPLWKNGALRTEKRLHPCAKRKRFNFNGGIGFT